MTSQDLAARLRDFAHRLDALRPLNHDPEKYFVDRDDIRQELEKLADEVRGADDRRNPRGKFIPGEIAANGRRVRVETRARPKKRAPTEIEKVFG